MLLLLHGFRAIWRLRRDPQFRAVSLLALVALASGAAFYSVVEGLSAVDAVYFSVITLTTVGYGDFAPKTDIGKLFTAAYVLVGIGVIFAFVTTLAPKMSRASRPESTSSDPRAHLSGRIEPSRHPRHVPSEHSREG